MREIIGNLNIEIKFFSNEKTIEKVKNKKISFL